MKDTLSRIKQALNQEDFNVNEIVKIVNDSDLSNQEKEEVYQTISSKTLTSNISSYYKNIGKYKLLTVEEEKDLVNKMKNGDEDARRKLINSNLRLVISIARRYRGYGVPFADLIQEGNIGLIEGIEKYDPNKGTKLGTYAIYWIKHRIFLTIKSSRLIRIPSDKESEIAKLKKAEEKLTYDLNHEPTDEQVAKYMGISEEYLLNLRQLSADIMSLNKKIGEGEDKDTELSDIIESEELTDEIAINNIQMDKIYKIIDNTLNDREKEIIYQRFGLKNNRQLTEKEIGAKYGISKSRVSAIENTCLKKLKKKIKRLG